MIKWKSTCFSLSVIHRKGFCYQIRLIFSYLNSGENPVTILLLFVSSLLLLLLLFEIILKVDPTILMASIMYVMLIDNLSISGSHTYSLCCYGARYCPRHRAAIVHANPFKELTNEGDQPTLSTAPFKTQHHLNDWLLYMETNEGLIQ